MGSPLVVGAAGQLGVELARRLSDRGALGLPREALDVMDAAAVEGAIDAIRPSVVVNCAAYVDVDRCETPDGAAMAWRVNMEGVRNVAAACARHGARLVHVSTNYVFDGGKDSPYVESDLPIPRSVYGITKLAGEHAALAYAPGALVVRTSGLYGVASNRSKGGNFVERILRRARDGGTLAVVADQCLTPTSTADLAVAMVAAMEAGAAGILHLTNAGSCSWHEFAVTALRLAAVDAPVAAIETTAPPGVASRPRNGILASERVPALGLGELRPWPDALAAYMRAAGLSSHAVFPG
jgi:dTDP-4-dehydrorhamnose reductase